MAKYKVIQAYNDNEVGSILEMPESDAVSLLEDGRVELCENEEDSQKVDESESQPASDTDGATAPDESSTENAVADESKSE